MLIRFELKVDMAPLPWNTAVIGDDCDELDDYGVRRKK